LRSPCARLTRSDNIDTARRILTNLAQRTKDGVTLEQSLSLHEGLEETLTVIDLGLPKALRHDPSLRRVPRQTTNVIENTLSTSLRIQAKNVKHWKNGKMVLRR